MGMNGKQGSTGPVGRGGRLSPWLVLGVASVGLISLGMSSFARAQQAGSEPSAGEPPAPAAETQLTPAQMLAEARSTLERIEKGAEFIRGQLREARDSKDVVKTLCLDDKLTQMDVARRSAVDRVAGLESAAQTGESDRARHEFAVVAALNDRSEALKAEANQCIGEETGSIGDAKVVITVDPDIALMEPTIPTDPLISVPPVLASPTL